MWKGALITSLLGLLFVIGYVLVEIFSSNSVLPVLAGKEPGGSGMTMLSWGIGLLVVVALFASAIRILREYQRSVVFMLGRFWKVKGPGLIILIPGIQQMVRVDMRTIVMDVPTQDVISKDNVSVCLLYTSDAADE